MINNWKILYEQLCLYYASGVLLRQYVRKENEDTESTAVLHPVGNKNNEIIQLHLLKQ